MSGEEFASIIGRYDQISRELENNALGRLDLALETSYNRLEEQLIRSYPKIQANDSLIPTQRAVLIHEELKELLSFIHPQNRNQYESEFQRLLTTSSQKGTSLADELLRLRSGDSFVKATATIPIEAVAFASRDSVDRLSRHSEDFRLKATGLINQGLIQGWGVQRVAREMRNQLGSTKSSAERIVRTQTIDATDKATRFIYKQNGIEYVQRIATQDSRVCGICAARAGNVYPIDIAPAVIHPQDRCYNMPWMPEWEQKGLTDNEWIKRHAKDAQAQTQDKLNYGLAPFEKAAGLTALLRTVWKPGEGYIDKEVERRAYNLAVANLAMRQLSNNTSINQTQPPAQENQLLNALIIGAAIVGTSVTAYYLAKARYRARFKKSAQEAAELASRYKANLDDELNDTGTEKTQISFFVGGFAGKEGKGVTQEEKNQIKAIIPEHHFINFEYPEFDTPYSEHRPNSPWIDDVAGLVGRTLANGKNPAAIRLAAAAKAHHEKYGKPINLIGHSGGGLVVSEAVEILNLMGIPTKAVLIGTPSMGFFEASPDQLITVMHKGDAFRPLNPLNPVYFDHKPGWPLEVHTLLKYLENDAVTNQIVSFLDGSQRPAINPEVLGGETTKFKQPKGLQSEPIDVNAETIQDPAINPEVLGGETTKFKQPKGLQSEIIDVNSETIREILQSGIQPKAGLPAADDINETLINLVPQLAMLPADQINKLPPALANRIFQILKENPQASDVELPKILPGFAPILALPEAELAKAIMRGELIKINLPEVELEPVTVEARNELEQRIAANLHKQIYSSERAYARLAEGRIRQRVAEINRQNLPPLPKLQQLRKAIFEEIQNVTSEVKPIKPPGVANEEQMHSFRFGKAIWYASGKLKESSPELDLVRQITELELPSEITQHVNNIYISKQKNASEAYLRKKLKFAGRVPAAPNLEDGSITFHSGRANREEFLRQAAYLKAHKEWGQLTPPEGSDYYLAMQQEKPTTGYATRGAAQDFADSVSQFFVSPDHLKRFSPARYEAISRMLNYSHPRKPVPPIPPLPPPDPRIIKAAQERLASINQKFQAIADIPKLRMDLAGAIGKKVSEQLNKFKVRKLLQDSDRLATESTSNQQKLLEQTNNQNRKLDDLERLVIEAETAYNQLLNPLNTPYFDTAPAKLAQLKRQIDAANREIAAVERAAKNAAIAKDKAQKIQQLMDELTTQRDTLKLSAQTRKLQKQVENLNSELDEAQQALTELPQSEERSKALRDLVKLRAEIGNLQSAENPNVQDFQRRTLQPYLDRANQTTKNFQEIAVKARETRDKFVGLQQRFSRLPTRTTQLSPEQQQRYKQIQILRRTQGELPTQIATFRDLSNKHQEQLAILDQARQKAIEDYSIQRPSAVNNIQAKIERTLQIIESNLQELRAFPPGTIAWVLDSKNWETTEMPSDLAIALQSTPGETKQEKLKKFVTKIETAYTNINAFVESIEKDLDYPDQVAATAIEKINSNINRWKLIEIQLEGNIKNISARKLKQLMANPEKINIQDVLGYAQQTAADLDAWNRLYVEMALSDDTIDPKAIIDQSEAYRKAREMFGEEIADLQANIIQTIRANLEANKAAKEMISTEAAKPLAYQINGKMMSPEEIKAQLQTIVPELAKYLKIPEISDMKITLPPEEIERQNQIKLETEKAAQKRAKIQKDPQLLELRGNLRTVVSELTRQRENAATTGYLPPRYRKFLEIRIAKLEKDQGDLQAQIQTRLEALNND